MSTPVIADGFRRFQNVYEAARWLREQENSSANLKGLASNIHRVLREGHGSVYGHTFQKDVYSRLPAEYEAIIDKQKIVIGALHKMIVLSAENNRPLTDKAIETSAKLLKSIGLGE